MYRKLLSAAVLPLVLIACGGSDPEVQEASQTASPTSETTPAETTDSSSPEPSPTHSPVSTTTAPAPAAPEPEPEPEPEKDTVTYSVTGSARQAMVTYSTEGGGGQRQETVTLPWSITIPDEGGFSFYSVLAQNQGSSGDITCAITKGGEVISENTSSGAYTIATCSGS